MNRREGHSDALRVEKRGFLNGRHRIDGRVNARYLIGIGRHQRNPRCRRYRFVRSGGVFHGRPRPCGNGDDEKEIALHEEGVSSSGFRVFQRAFFERNRNRFRSGSALIRSFPRTARETESAPFRLVFERARFIAFAEGIW